MTRFKALMAALPLLTACGTAPMSSTENYEACLRAERGCAPERLDEAQRARIEAIATAAHLEDCMNRRRCNESMLSDTERAQVRASVARLNLESCRRGEVECNERLLDEAQSEEVAELSRRRNLDHCLGGLTLCDPNRLTEAEAQAVHDAYLRRNFQGCMNAVGTLLECNPGDLTAEEMEAVRRRGQAAIEYLCDGNYFACDLTRLTAEQLKQKGAGAPAR